MSTTIALPERALTLLPPWPQAIAFSDKRLENRGYGVARQLGTWRGLVGLSQSKKWDEPMCLHGSIFDPTAEPARSSLRSWAGCLVLVAELLHVLPPEHCEGDVWHVPGQWGLILGRVWEVEPVPCTGGVGAWTVEWCEVCLRVLADSARGCPDHRAARRIRDGLARPTLRVVRECLA